MSDFDLLLNGAPIPNSKLVLLSNSFTAAQVTIAFKNGSQGAGKLVTIQTSAPLYISAVQGTLDANGRMTIVIGPGFNMRGDVSITVAVQNKKKSLDIQFI